MNKTVQIKPIEQEDALPDALRGEDAFTPVTEDNAYEEEVSRLCGAYGVGQDLGAGCSYCILQLRCLNLMRQRVPMRLEHYREKHFSGKPFLSEAVRDMTAENIEQVLEWTLEDLEVYQDRKDPLNETRLLKLLSIFAEEHLSTVDPRIPVLLLERLRMDHEDRLKVENGLYLVTATDHE